MSELSFNSFFERTSFNYANNDEKLAKGNFFKVFLFQNTILQSSEINGYVLLKVNNKLPEGKIFLRLETSAVKSLNENNENSCVNDEIEKLKSKFKEKTPNTVSQESRNLVMTWRKSNEIESNEELPRKMKHSFHNLEFRKEPTAKGRSTFVEKQRSVIPKQIIKSKFTINVTEYEIFKLEKSIERLTYLVLPFRISLDNEIEITTFQNLLNIIEASPEKNEAKPKGLPALEIGNVFSRQLGVQTLQKVDLLQHQNESEVDKRSPKAINFKKVIQDQASMQEISANEYVSIENELVAYYITNSTYSEGQQKIKDDAITRYQFYQNKENFCQWRIDLKILPDFVSLSHLSCSERVKVTIDKNNMISIVKDMKPNQKPIESSDTKKEVSVDSIARGLENGIFRGSSAIGVTLYDKISRELPNSPSKTKSKFRGSLTMSMRQSLEQKGIGDMTNIDQNGKKIGCLTRLKECFLKSTVKNYSINVSIDKISYTNADNVLNFVLKFDYDLIKYFNNLDVTICSRVEYTTSENKQIVMERVLLHEQFVLSKKMPTKKKPNAQQTKSSNSPQKPTNKKTRDGNNNEGGDMIEYLNKINISEITSKYQSLSIPSFKLEFYIQFYISPDKQHFAHKILNNKLTLSKMPEDYVIYDRIHISHLFYTLERACNSDENCVMLPYANISLKEKHPEEEMNDMIDEDEIKINLPD